MSISRKLRYVGISTLGFLIVWAIFKAFDGEGVKVLNIMTAGAIYAVIMWLLYPFIKPNK